MNELISLIINIILCRHFGTQCWPVWYHTPNYSLLITQWPSACPCIILWKCIFVKFKSILLLGEALLEENDFDDEDEEEESDNDDDDEDDDDDEGNVNDPEYNPRQDKLLNKQVHPNECKQQ